MWGSLDIPTSGMIAQRTRLDAVVANLANKEALYNAKGEYEPYLRRVVRFAEGDPSATTAAGRSMGVHVASIDTDENALRLKYDPSHPNADKDGNIKVPDINSVIEQVDAMAAARAYDANIAAAEAIKQMATQAIGMLV